MPGQLYFEAKLQKVDADEDAQVPTLTVELGLKAGSGGSGPSYQLPFAEWGTSRVHLLNLDAFLGWNPDMRVDVDPFVAKGFPKSIRANVLAIDQPYPEVLKLAIPLTASLLSQLMEADSEGNPRFAVNLRISGLVEHRPSAGGTSSLHPFLLDNIVVSALGANSRVLEIERSAWINRILPKLGAGNWAIYEIPRENFEGSALADKYLQNAYRQFLSGEYKLSMAASRDVVETLERELGASANPAFSDRFGKADRKMRRVVETFGELINASLEYQASLKSLLAAGAHPEKEDQLVDRPDAEMALYTALALRRYVGMRIRDARPPAFLPETPPEQDALPPE